MPTSIRDGLLIVTFSVGATVAIGAELNPKPSNLADADWKHGATDGEIFTVIRDGVKSTGMKPYARKLTTHQIWDVVNYVRSLGPKTGSR